MSTLLEAGFSEDRAATVYHVLGSYTLGLGYARMLGDEVQTTDIVAQLIGHWADYPSMMRVGMRLAVWDRPGEFETGLDVLLAHFADRPGAARVTPGPRREERRRRPAGPRCAARPPAAPGQDDQPGQDGRGQPLLALDQVLAVPAARPRHPGRLSGPGRRDRPAGRARRDAAPRRRARPRRHRGVHHLGRARLPLRRPLPRQGRLRLPRRAAPDEPAGGGRPARRQRVLRPGRGHLAGVPARLPRRPAQAAVPLDRADARRPPAGAPRPHQARALPGAQLARREPRLPAPLRLLLQGGVLPRRQVVLRAGGRRCPGRDRPPPRPPPLLPRRQPLRQPAVRRGALRRPQGHGPPVAGGRDGGGASCAPASSRRRWRAGCAACSSASRR